MEATLNYREKLWTESLDMVNNNLMQKADAFGYLYKEHQKKIKRLIEKKD